MITVFICIFWTISMGEVLPDKHSKFRRYYLNSPKVGTLLLFKVH